VLWRSSGHLRNNNNNKHNTQTLSGCQQHKEVAAAFVLSDIQVAVYITCAAPQYICYKLFRRLLHIVTLRGGQARRCASLSPVKPAFLQSRNFGMVVAKVGLSDELPLLPGRCGAGVFAELFTTTTRGTGK
jgi:hypothetical protein